MTHTEPAFAKLNLTLDILGKREDGYHDMQIGRASCRDRVEVIV